MLRRKLAKHRSQNLDIKIKKLVNFRGLVLTEESKSQKMSGEVRIKGILGLNYWEKM